MYRISYRATLGIALGAAILLSMFAGQAMGQAISTDARIVGVVSDESEGVLPGATVTATSPALQVPSVTSVSDAEGAYRLMGLPIGIYAVEYTLPGFQTLKREGIRLTVGFSARLNVTLILGGLEETVTVTGESPLVDVTSTSTQTQLTEDELQLVPTGGSGLASILSMVPGARPRVEVGGSSLNQNPQLNSGADAGAAGGDTIAQTWQAVEGVVTKNPRSTESGNYFDLSWAEEATAATFDHAAEVPSRGLSVNVLFPTGGNQFSGRAGYEYTSSSLEAEPSPRGGGGSTALRDNFGVEIGGRLIRDRIWFWGSFRNQRNENEVLDCVKPDGTPCDFFSKAKFYTTKWTGQLTESQKVTGFLMLNRGPQIRDVSALSPWESRRQFRNQVDVAKVEWQGVFGDALVASANWGRWKGYSGTTCPGGPFALQLEGTDFAACDASDTATFDSRTREITGLNRRCCERLFEGRQQVRGSLSYFKPDWGGDHEFKAGVEYYNAPANRHNVGRGDALEMRLRFRGGSADRVELYNYATVTDLVLAYTGFYFADSWNVSDRLTLNLGLRFAADRAYENAATRVAANGVSAQLWPAETFPRSDQTDLNNWAPRARAAYDLTGDGKTVLKGGWGRYQTMRFAEQLYLVAQNALETGSFRWRDNNNNRLFDDGESVLDFDGPDFISLRSSAAADGALVGGSANPDEKATYTDEFSLTLERQLLPSLAVRGTFLERRIKNAQRVLNTERPFSAYNIAITDPDPGPDGDVGTADDTGNNITYFDYPDELVGAEFQKATIVNDKAADGWYRTMEFLVTKRLANRWHFMGSYSATRKNYPLSANADVFNTVDPNSEINGKDKTWEWLARASGSYIFPWDILVSGTYEHRSGNVTAREADFGGADNVGSLELRVEPIGSIRLPNLNLVTLRVEKQFVLPGAQRLIGRMDIHNATNTDIATAMTVASGSNFGRVNARILPRIISFEVEYRF